MAITPSGNVVRVPRCLDTPKFGLLSAVEPLRLTDPIHFQATGITWEDFLCGPPASGFIDQCPPVDPYQKPTERSSNFCSADPFVAYGSYECPPVGRTTSEAFEISRQRLLNWEGYQVEQILWTGQSANGTVNPSFALGNPDCDIVPIDLSPSGAVDPVTAIALIENELGKVLACGGTIHVPYGLLAYFQNARLLVQDGDAYYTPTGYRLIAGHGYPGSGPNNVAAAQGETWVFATGPIVLARGDVMMVPDNIKESVDRQINNVTVRAERFYSVGFSCALLALRVKLSCACC